MNNCLTEAFGDIVAQVPNGFFLDDHSAGPLSDGWAEYVHPEGNTYYYQPERGLSTSLDPRDPRINNCLTKTTAPSTPTHTHKSSILSQAVSVKGGVSASKDIGPFSSQIDSSINAATVSANGSFGPSVTVSTATPAQPVISNSTRTPPPPSKVPTAQPQPETSCSVPAKPTRTTAIPVNSRNQDRTRRRKHRKPRNDSLKPNAPQPSHQQQQQQQAAVSELEPVVSLQATKNRWTPAARSRLAVDENSPGYVEKKVKGLLNKLTLENFDSVSSQIISWANKSENEKKGATLILVIELVFGQAIDDENCSETYARLCRKLMEEISQNVQDDLMQRSKDGEVIVGGHLFRKYLLNRCQEGFERGWSHKESAQAAAALKTADDKAAEDASKADGGNGEQVLYSDEHYDLLKAKRQGVGLVRFLGELFKLQMLTERIMHECIVRLLSKIKNPEEEEIESLCKLMTTVGQALDTPRAKGHMDIYFGRMQVLADSQNVASRVRYMLLDVIELRLRSWRPRNAIADPPAIESLRLVSENSTAPQSPPATFASVPAVTPPVDPPLTHRDDDIGQLITNISPHPIYINGHFGDVFKGFHQEVGEVALKRLRIGGMGDEELVVRRFEREANTWRHLEHPHILKFLGTLRYGGHLYFVSPFIKNGTLLQYVKDQVDVNRIRLLCETAAAIDYLHQKSMVHGDIKAGNLLISDDNHVLLCDFGLTKPTDAQTSTTMKGAGTARWQSPELWDNASKTFGSDVYAFSMTIVEVLTGDRPFPHLPNDMAVFRAVYFQDERPEKSPLGCNGISYENAWQVAERCWSKLPEDRMLMSEALRRFREDPSLVPITFRR